MCGFVWRVWFAVVASSVAPSVEGNAWYTCCFLAGLARRTISESPIQVNRKAEVRKQRNQNEEKSSPEKSSQKSQVQKNLQKRMMKNPKSQPNPRGAPIILNPRLASSHLPPPPPLHKQRTSSLLCCSVASSPPRHQLGRRGPSARHPFSPPQLPLSLPHLSTARKIACAALSHASRTDWAQKTCGSFWSVYGIFFCIKCRLELGCGKVAVWSTDPRLRLVRRSRRLVSTLAPHGHQPTSRPVVANHWNLLSFTIL